MITKKQHLKIYKSVTGLLSKKALTRVDLLDTLINSEGFSADELSDCSLNCPKNVFRSVAGTVISEMLLDGVIVEDGSYLKLASNNPVTVRIESCEREILKLVTRSPRTKREMRSELTKFFGTDKTPTLRDDGILTDFIGRTLNRLTDAGVITLSDGYYSLSESVVAKADDIGEIMTLKSDFLKKLHSKGGEFFEHYFMNLLSKYLEKQGKKVVSCSTTGGADDGGIDGIVKTVDQLGFRETVMVQTKNRNVDASETDVRGFYGALCAAKGTRGIYAINSTLHPKAKEFLDGIDECVAVDADKLFAMAVECLYGICKVSGKLRIDKKVI